MKNTLIPSTRDDISTLQGKLAMEEAGLNLIKDEKVFLEDFKWKIRTRGFTIFNLIYPPSLITLVIILFVLVLILAGVAIIGVILETLIRILIFSQDIEFEDTFIYIPIKAVEDFIYYPPSIPIPILVGLLIVCIVYSIRQIRKNRVYYEDVVILENRRKNALVPGKRRKQQIIVDNLKNTRQSTETQLLNYQAELQDLLHDFLSPVIIRNVDLKPF